MTAARCSAGAVVEISLIAPMKATPQPTPRIAELARKSPGELVESDAIVAPIPTASTSEPQPIAARGGRRWKTSCDSPPGPAIARTAAPPARWLSVSNSCAASDGDSARYSPPIDQDEITPML